MKFYEKAKEIEIYGNYDTVVCGGGIAGIAAALAAKRGGAKTLLIEKEFMLGGLGTAGLVTIYLPLCDGNGTQLSFGIAEELFKLSISEGYEDRYPKAWLEGGTLEEKKKTRFEVQYNAQMFAILAEKLLLSEGVEILYGTSVCATQVETDRISHIIIENKSGRQAVELKNIIDCTGDADICRFAGEDTAEHGKGNVLAAWFYECNKDGYSLNMHGFSDRVGVTKLENRLYKGLDGKELTEMTFSSHNSIHKKFLEGGKITKDHALATIASIPQVRMTRRLVGCYTMTVDDDKKVFEDSVGMFSNWYQAGPQFELPYSALHGKKIKNLACAGRCISSDDPMWNITRVIPVCAVSGEAVGTAAAMSANFDGIDIKKLQKKLTENGVKIHL